MRWVVGVLIALVLLVGVLRLWWGYSSEAKLQAVVAQIRARGEPLAWRDFAPKPIPDEDNAAELYKKAARHPAFGAGPVGESLPPEQEGRARALGEMVADLLTHPALRRKHAARTAEVLEETREALALCRQARRLEGVDWKMDFDAPALGSVLPAARPRMRLGNALCLAGLAAHDAGDDAAALEHFRDAMALAWASRRLPALVGFLMASGHESVALQALERVAPTLTVGGEGKGPPAEDVRRLIADLLDDRDLRQGMVRAMMAERSTIYDTCERVRRGETLLTGIAAARRPPSVLRRLGTWLFLKPMYTADEAYLLTHMNGYVLAARAPSHPQAMAQAPVLPGLTSKLWGFHHVLSAILLPALGRCYELHHRALAMRRSAATALAIRLYELDRGQRPARLDELTPKYLPAVPLDPFSKTGQGIRYLPQADPPLLYSVSTDGRDDGGKFNVDSGGGLEIGTSPDWVFFLDGNRPAPEPQSVYLREERQGAQGALRREPQGIHGPPRGMSSGAGPHRGDGQ